MLNTLNDVLNNVDNFIWGMPLIILILFTGILLTVRLRGLQIRHLGKALHYVFHNEDDGEQGVRVPDGGDRARAQAALLDWRSADRVRGPYVREVEDGCD